jgi:hypothetical protein
MDAPTDLSSYAIVEDTTTSSSSGGSASALEPVNNSV